jgi:tetratricopeptide (TPR) repeat protein
VERYRIFVSSPGDVGKERHLAEQVIRRVAAEFQDRGEVETYFWEYEPMESTRDYQENIPLTSEFDLVISILWKRLGSPLHLKHEHPEGGPWRSGTEFELVTAKLAKQHKGVPDIFIFKNDTKATFEDDEETNDSALDEQIAQRRALKRFLREWCEEEQDGHKVFTAALNRYTELSQFEQTLEKLLRQKLREIFGGKPATESRVLQRPTATWTEGSPFRGLEAFDFQHAAVFCGRTRAVGEVLERLRIQAETGRPFVLITGASGSGKSSLAMAGVLPLLVKPGTIEGVGLWRRVIFQPGRKNVEGDVFDRFANALLSSEQEGEGLPELASDGESTNQLAAELRSNPAGATILIRGALNQVAAVHREREAHQIRDWIDESQEAGRSADAVRYGHLLAGLTQRETRLALVIDQAEELFTSEDLNRPELREKFATALTALVRGGRVFVLMTLRTDFYPRLQELPALIDLKGGDGLYDLLLPTPPEIAQMIRQPALDAGLIFEIDAETRQSLDEVLADEVKAEPRLLPLLEFALDELYKQRDEQGVLTFAAFRQHLDASIVRALARRADATLASLPYEWEREAFRSVMRRLATAVETESAAGAALGSGAGAPAFQRLRVLYQGLTARPPGAKALVDAFVKARLLVVEGRDEPEVTVAHEALFERWEKLRELLISERNDLILPRARLIASCQRWLAARKLSDYLLPSGKQLAEAEHLLAHYGEELSPELHSYITGSIAAARASLERERRRTRIVMATVSLFAVAAAGFGGVSFWQYRQAEEARRQADLRKRQADVSAELAKRARDGAEQMVQFMTFDLRDKLQPIGRLEILDSVIAKVQQYYKAFPAQDEAVDVLRRRSVVLVNQAEVLLAQGKLDQALEAHQAALDIRQRLVERDPTKNDWQADLAVSFGGVGDVLVAQSKWDQALAPYQRGRDILRMALQRDPSQSDWQTNLAGSLKCIGDVMREQGKPAEALEAYQQCRDILRTLVQQNQTNSRQELLSISLGGIGDVLRAQGKLDQALEAYQEERDTVQKLVQRDQTNSDWQHDLAFCLLDFGDVLEERNRADQAMAAYQQANDILRKLVQQDPTNGVWQRDLSMGLGRVGDLLKAEGKLDEALEVYQQTRDILQKLVQLDPSNGRWQANLARAYLRLGVAFKLKLQPVEARAVLVRAQEILRPLQNEHQLSVEARGWLEETEKQLAE